MGLSHPKYKVSLVDGSPKLFLEQELICRNRNCSNNGKVVDTKRTELEVEAE